MVDVAKVMGLDVSVVSGAPSGLIVIWHGTIGAIPAGWVICDGGSSTPNLLTRFVQGVATALTDPGATGGATGKTTTGHIHTMLSHTHTFGTHTHTEGDTVREGDGAWDAWEKGASDPTDPGDANPRDPGDANSNTDGIADIRPLFYDIAYLMKT